jgi:hypothetical protein
MQSAKRKAHSEEKKVLQCRSKKRKAQSVEKKVMQ